MSKLTWQVSQFAQGCIANKNKGSTQIVLSYSFMNDTAASSVSLLNQNSHASNTRDCYH